MKRLVPCAAKLLACANTALCSFLLLGATLASGQERSADEILSLLTHPTMADSARECGSLEKYHALAAKLSGMREAALLALERALNSLDREGEDTRYAPNSDWWLQVCGEIEGPRALPRLRRMVADPRLSVFSYAIDAAIARSLSITSFISGALLSTKIASCSGLAQPRYVLDQLILAWIRRDQELFKGTLGPRATRSLERMAGDGNWEAMRASFGPDRSPSVMGLGYQFLEGNAPPQMDSWLASRTEGSPPSQIPATWDATTVFKDSNGAECGRYDLRFVRRSLAQGVGTGYFADPEDLPYLLSVITACLAH